MNMMAGGRMLLCVEDNGIGISESDLPRIFEKGFTGKNGRIVRNTTGIGLYLCKRLCDKLGVEERNIRQLILKQLGIWFGLPVALAVLLSAVLTGYFLNVISAQVAAYIGREDLIGQLALTAGILLLLLICYFISTWILFQRSVGEK